MDHVDKAYRDRQKESIKRAAEAIGEDFDSVLILASRNSEQGTEFFYQGTGNIFARLGMANSYLDSTFMESEGFDILKDTEDEDA